MKQNQDILSSSNRNLEIFVTETGITGGRYPDPQVFNLYKGLILFEMQMEQINQGAQAAKVMSDADTGGENILSDIIGGIG